MVERKDTLRSKRQRRSRFDVYLIVYNRFNEELMKCDDPRAAMYAQNWIDAKAKFTGWLHDPEKKVRRSSMANGMEQGLRDTFMILEGYPAPIRERLTKAFRQILEEEAPDFPLPRFRQAGPHRQTRAAAQ